MTLEEILLNPASASARISQLTETVAKLQERVRELTPVKGHKYEDVGKAVNFALQHRSGEGMTFLDSWAHGDWDDLERDWPEWVALFEENKEGQEND